MDKFQETYCLPKLNKKIDNLNRLITRIEIESVENLFFCKQNPVLDGFAREFYQTYKEFMPHLLNSSKRLKKKEHSQRHSLKPPSP